MKQKLLDFNTERQVRRIAEDLKLERPFSRPIELLKKELLKFTYLQLKESLTKQK